MKSRKCWYCGGTMRLNEELGFFVCSTCCATWCEKASARRSSQILDRMDKERSEFDRLPRSSVFVGEPKALI